MLRDRLALFLPGPFPPDGVQRSDDVKSLPPVGASLQQVVHQPHDVPVLKKLANVDAGPFLHRACGKAGELHISVSERCNELDVLSWHVRVPLLDGFYHRLWRQRLDLNLSAPALNGGLMPDGHEAKSTSCAADCHRPAGRLIRPCLIDHEDERLLCACRHCGDCLQHAHSGGLTNIENALAPPGSPAQLQCEARLSHAGAPEDVNVRDGSGTRIEGIARALHHRRLGGSRKPGIAVLGITDPVR